MKRFIAVMLAAAMFAGLTTVTGCRSEEVGKPKFAPDSSGGAGGGNIPNMGKKGVNPKGGRVTPPPV